MSVLLAGGHMQLIQTTIGDELGHFPSVRRIPVFQVILGNVSYDEACRTLDVSPLSDRHIEQCKTLGEVKFR